MAGRRERKREDTENHIIEKTMELITANGYDETTMEQIAAASDVAKGTLYSHFPVKEAILAAYMRQKSADGGSYIDSLLTGGMNTKGILSILFSRVADRQLPNRYIFSKYISYRLTNLVNCTSEKQSGPDRYLLKIITKGIEKKELRGDIPPETLVTFLESSYLLVMLKWLNDETCDLRTELEKVIDMFLNGVLNSRKYF